MGELRFLAEVRKGLQKAGVKVLARVALFGQAQMKLLMDEMANYESGLRMVTGSNQNSSGSRSSG